MTPIQTNLSSTVFSPPICSFFRSNDLDLLSSFISFVSVNESIFSPEFFFSFYKNVFSFVSFYILTDRKRNSIRHKSNLSNIRHRANGHSTHGPNNLSDARQSNILPVYNATSWMKSSGPNDFQRQSRVGSPNQVNVPPRNREFHVPRHHTGGIRNRIQFNDTKNWPNQRSKHMNQWKYRPTTNRPDTAPTTFVPIRFVPTNDANHERLANVQDAQDRQRASDERIRQEKNERRERERIETIKRDEEQRNEEKRQREEQEKYMRNAEQRQKVLEEQRRKEYEEQQYREQEEQRRKQLAEERRQERERQQRKELEEQRRKQLDEQRRREMNLDDERRYEQQKHEIQTNEILDRIEVSTVTTQAPATENQAKKLKLRNKLKTLSPAELERFIQRRQERMKAKKRESHQSS